MVEQQETEVRCWRKACFQFNWPENEPPKTFLDLVVAHLLVAPLVRNHDLRLWRVHRRWKRTDANGHEFWFSFYESHHAASEINREIGRSPVVVRLSDPGLLGSNQGLLAKQPQVEVKGADIGAEAESNWPEAIRDAWPFYICGVSQMWLALIESQVRGVGLDVIDDASLQQFWQAEQTINAIWTGHGHHTMLHHLNAVFGGTPVVVGPVPLRF